VKNTEMGNSSSLMQNASKWSSCCSSSWFSPGSRRFRDLYLIDLALVR